MLLSRSLGRSIAMPAWRIVRAGLKVADAAAFHERIGRRTRRRTLAGGGNGWLSGREGATLPVGIRDGRLPVVTVTTSMPEEPEHERGARQHGNHQGDDAEVETRRFGGVPCR